MLRRALYVILALLISAAPVLIFSTPAFASTVEPASQASSSGGGFVCATNATSAGATANDLPINRWGSVSASEFTYLPGGPIGTIENLPNQSNRAIVGLVLSAGNSMWSATSSLTNIAEQFCFGAQAAGAANNVTAGLWKFITKGFVLPVLIVVGIILLAWRARKGTKIGKEVIRIVVVAAIISTLGIESAKTTASDVQTGNYPTFSPAWIVSTAYGALSSVVSAPLAGINTLAGTVQLGKGTSGAGYGMGCPAYTNELLTKYRQSYGANPAVQSEAVVPEVVNSIWDNSGLQATAMAQFGSNNYTASAYCHLYEQEAGISPTAQIAIARAAGKIPPNPSAQSLAFLPEGATPQEEVASLVGWAACTKPNSTALRPSAAWSGVQYKPSTGLLGGAAGALVQDISGPQTITASDCQKWWSTPASSWNYQGTALYWSPSTSTISSATANAPGVADFLFNFFGDTSNGAAIVAIVYAISSLAVLITFGLLSLAVIVAKFGLLLLMALFIIFLVVDLVPGRSGGHHATKFLKQGVSFMVLAIGAEAILGMVALLTNIIDRFGIGVAGSGMIGMLWIAISPVAAIWGIHHILKTFRIPSPFRPDAAMGWASAAGAGGFITGAMGEKLAGGYQRLRSAGTNGLRSGVHRAKGAVSTKPDKRLYAPKQMPAKDLGGNAGWKAKTNGSGGSSTGGAGGTEGTTGSGGGRRRFQPGPVNGKGTGRGTSTPKAPTTSGRHPAATAKGGSQASSKTNNRGQQARQKMSNNALDAFKQKAAQRAAESAQETKSRWSLNRPAQKPTKINGAPYRTPSQMRLEGTQKAANNRKAMKSAVRDAKKFARQQAGPLPKRVANAAGERAQLAWARAKADPGKTARRAAGYTAAAALMPFSAPVVAGVLGAHYATKKVRTALAERPAKKAEKNAHYSYISRNVLKDKPKRPLSAGSVIPTSNGQTATQKYRGRRKATPES